MALFWSIQADTANVRHLPFCVWRLGKGNLGYSTWLIWNSVRRFSVCVCVLQLSWLGDVTSLLNTRTDFVGNGLHCESWKPLISSVKWHKLWDCVLATNRLSFTHWRGRFVGKSVRASLWKRECFVSHESRKLRWKGEAAVQCKWKLVTFKKNIELLQIPHGRFQR